MCFSTTNNNQSNASAGGGGTTVIREKETIREVAPAQTAAPVVINVQQNQENKQQVKQGGGTVGSVTRAEKTQQRAADAEKRKTEPEPARLKPGSVKPGKTPPVNIGATPAMTMPVVKPPVPTIDVIDEPGTSSAIGQMAQSLSDPAKSPALGQVAQSLTKPPAIEPIMNPDQALPTRLGQPVDKDAEEVPNNVFQFPDRLSRTNKEPDDMDQPDLFDNPPRTGTYNESQELRRMRELPFTVNVTQELEKIEIEKMRDSLLGSITAYTQAIPQMAASGGDASEVVRKIAAVIKARQKGQALEDAIEATFAPQQQVPPAGAAPMVEQPSPAPTASPAGGALPPEAAPQGEAPAINARPDMQTLISALTSSGKGSARVSTTTKR